MRENAEARAVRLMWRSTSWPYLAFSSIILSAIAIANWYFPDVAGISVRSTRIYVRTYHELERSGQVLTNFEFCMPGHVLNKGVLLYLLRIMYDVIFKIRGIDKYYKVVHAVHLFPHVNNAYKIQNCHLANKRIS